MLTSKASKIIPYEDRTVCINDCLKVKEITRNNVRTKLKSTKSKIKNLDALFSSLQIENIPSYARPIASSSSSPSISFTPPVCESPKPKISKQKKQRPSTANQTLSSRYDKGVREQKNESSPQTTSPKRPTASAKRQTAWLRRIEHKNRDDECPPIRNDGAVKELLDSQQLRVTKESWFRAQRESSRVLIKQKENSANREQAQQRLKMKKLEKTEQQLLEAAKWNSSVIPTLRQVQNELHYIRTGQRRPPSVRSSRGRSPTSEKKERSRESSDQGPNFTQPAEIQRQSSNKSLVRWAEEVCGADQTGRIRPGDSPSPSTETPHSSESLNTSSNQYNDMEREIARLELEEKRKREEWEIAEEQKRLQILAAEEGIETIPVVEMDQDGRVISYGHGHRVYFPDMDIDSPREEYESHYGIDLPSSEHSVVTGTSTVPPVDIVTFLTRQNRRSVENRASPNVKYQKKSSHVLDSIDEFESYSPRSVHTEDEYTDDDSEY